MIDAFLAANGVARLIFFYQEPEAPPPDAGGTEMVVVNIIKFYRHFIVCS